MDLFSKLEIPKGVKRRVKERLKPYVKVENYRNNFLFNFESFSRMLLPVI